MPPQLRHTHTGLLDSLTTLIATNLLLCFTLALLIAFIFSKYSFFNLSRKRNRKLPSVPPKRISSCCTSNHYKNLIYKTANIDLQDVSNILFCENNIYLFLLILLFSEYPVLSVPLFKIVSPIIITLHTPYTCCVQ